MANKKRRKSNTERMKYEAKKQAKQARDAQKKKITIIAVLSFLAVAVIVGIVFGTIGIVRSIKRSDYCAYKDNRDITGRDVVYAEIVVKDYGTITVLLDKTAAPNTVANFVELANDGFYDGLTFHRAIDQCIQGGDPSANGQGGHDDKDGNRVTIDGEFSSNGYKLNDLMHLRGVISMARGDDKNSASSQFFICTEDVSEWDGEYAAFGYVISGMRIVDRIQKDSQKAAGYNGLIADKANQIVIESIKIIGAETSGGNESGYPGSSPNETEEDRFD